MAEKDETTFSDVLTDEVLVGITEGLNQFSALLLQMAAYAEEKSREKTTHPGQELYWGGFIDGLRTAAQTAQETRPLRGIK